ncbi:hypothetical protein TIFTF001_041164 [Ficus carica]|uniref:Uncharacterized protein n=1 Tax=Ficus carica TaxID=3494 RepID=A0AA87Z2M8_FICCA|nr:hypothetical protein TIFTF001_041164 [Ficus carica]
MSADLCGKLETDVEIKASVRSSIAFSDTNLTTYPMLPLIKFKVLTYMKVNGAPSALLFVETTSMGVLCFLQISLSVPISKFPAVYQLEVQSLERLAGEGARLRLRARVSAEDKGLKSRAQLEERRRFSPRLTREPAKEKAEREKERKKKKKEMEKINK